MKSINLSEWALKHQQLVIYLISILLLSGMFAYQNLGQKEDPEFTFKAMVVQVYWPGASTKEVELQVLDKIEKKLQGIGEIDYMKSYAKPGEAQVAISLREDIHSKQAVYDVWYQVRKKLGDIKGSLPDGVVGPLFNDEFGDTFGNVYALTADGFGYADLKRYAESVRNELLKIPEVNKIELVGEQEEKIYIEFSNAKLAALGIEPALILQTLSTTNKMSSTGIVDAGSERIAIRTNNQLSSIDSIRKTPISANGHTLHIGDIATVRRGYIDPAQFKMRFNGKTAIGLAVSMKTGGDVIALGEHLNEAMSGIKTKLPVGIQIHAVSDQPRVVKSAISEFIHSLLEAVAIVLAVSFLSLGMRTGVVVALSIPLVLAITFLGMYLLGIDMQRISLGALIIALGLLVDDAIIAVEMMALKLEQGWDRMRAATFAYASTAYPMLTGTLITVAGFMPVGLAKSSAGEYAGSIFYVVGLSLMVSWLVAVLFTPYLGYKLLPEKNVHLDSKHGVDIYQRRFYVHFRKIVQWCLSNRRTVIITTVIAFLISVGLFNFVPKQFFPASSRPELMVDLWLPQAATFAETEKRVMELERQLQGDPDIISVTSYVGGGSPRFYLSLDQQLSNLNLGQLTVMTRNENVRERVYEKIDGLLKSSFPGVRGRVTRLENGPPVGYPVQFRVSGPNSERLLEIASEVSALIQANPHTRDVNIDWGERVKVIRLDVDRDKLRNLGISSLQLANTLQMSRSGIMATEFRDADLNLSVVGRYLTGERTNLSTLKDTTLYLPSGKQIPLSQVAHIQIESEHSLIWRRDRIPTITVRADVEGAQAPDITMAIWPALQELSGSLPLGYSIEIAGTQESSKTSEASIAAVMPLMLITIMTLLMFQLQNISKMILVLLTAPLGMIGVSAILFTFQVPFGFVAQLGVIALAGMIMRNSVILVDQIDQDIAAGAHPWDAIVESAVRRLRPIVLTAAAAILAMIPLTSSTFWGPMAWAIMGGLMVATMLTLMFLPALYAAWYRVGRPKVEGQS